MPDLGNPETVRTIERSREALGEESYTAAYGTGRTMSREAIAELIRSGELLPADPSGPQA
jgi:hypothetical protein